MSPKISDKMSLTAAISIVVVLSLVAMSPAKAFYLEVPQLVKNAWSMLKNLPVSAQEAENYQAPPPDNQQQAMQLENIKRGGRQMESQLKKFESMMKSAVQKGTVISQEVTDKVTRAKEILDKIKAANTMEEMADTTINKETDENELDTLQTLMQDLEQTRQNVFEATQRLDGLKRGIKGMTQGIKMFERQIANLTKKKIIIPDGTTETLTKIKALIEVVTQAKTWDEVESAGVEEMQDLMMSLDESRQKLEVLTRWPQTLKQMDRELKNLTNQLKRTKSIVTKLEKKGIDVTANYEQFATAIDKLKTVRDEAVAKIAAGESQDAFDLVENDFFGQMEDVWQNHRIIEIMSNMGRFVTDYKRGLAQAKQMIKKMEKNKVDMSEAKILLAQAEKQGEVVVSLIRARPIDADAVLAALEDFESIMQEFGNKMEELGAGPPPQPMPWEGGPPQLHEIKMSPGMDKYLPTKPTQPQQPIGTTPNNGDTMSQE